MERILDEFADFDERPTPAERTREPTTPLLRAGSKHFKNALARQAANRKAPRSIRSLQESTSRRRVPITLASKA